MTYIRIIKLKQYNIMVGNREIAMGWWNRKSDEYKDAITLTYYPGRDFTSLTGSEINVMYNKELSLKK